MLLDFSHQVSLVSLRPENLPASAGGQHTLQCSANWSSGLPPTTRLEIYWFDPQKNLIVPSNVLFAIIGDTVTYSPAISSRLVFNHVRTSLAGPYICAVRIAVPGMSTNYTVSKTLNFTVKSEDVCF